MKKVSGNKIAYSQGHEKNCYHDTPNCSQDKKCNTHYSLSPLSFFDPCIIIHVPVLFFQKKFSRHSIPYHSSRVIILNTITQFFFWGGIFVSDT